MAHLTEAIVIGLAGRSAPLRISFDRRMNILYGLNGSGKTSLLKILHSAMSGDASLLDNVPFKEASVTIYSVDYKKEFSRHIKKEPVNAEKSDSVQDNELILQAEFPELLRRHAARAEKLAWKEEPQLKRDKTSGWRHRYLPTARLHLADDPFIFAPTSRSRGSLSEELLDRYFADSLERLWVNYTSEMLRKVRDSQEKGLASILDAVLSAPQSHKPTETDIDIEKAYESVQRFMSRQSHKKHLGTIDQFSKRYKKNKSLRQVVHDIYKVEEDITLATTPRRELENIIHKLFTAGKKVSFTDRKICIEDANGKEIGLSTLSSGEKHLVRILVEALLADLSTIMIDEPELSLHVDWQTELVPTLKRLNSEAQFILATHSPEVMASVPDNQVFSL